MTKKIFSANLNEIKGLRISCRECKNYWFASFSNGKTHEQCAGCGKKIPWRQIWKAVSRINELIEMEDEHGLDFYIEQDEIIG